MSHSFYEPFFEQSTFTVKTNICENLLNCKELIFITLKKTYKVLIILDEKFIPNICTDSSRLLDLLVLMSMFVKDKRLNGT